MDHVGSTPEPATAAGREALDGMVGYFAKHVGRLGYADRLREGRSIGGGPVEGLARTMGRRLKAPGRGRLARHVEAWPPSSPPSAPPIGTIIGIDPPPPDLQDRELLPRPARASARSGGLDYTTAFSRAPACARSVGRRGAGRDPKEGGMMRRR